MDENKTTLYKLTWYLLIAAWITLLIPIPFTSLIAYPINVTCIILSIITIARDNNKKGVIQILCAFVITPIVHFIAIAIFGATALTAALTAGAAANSLATNSYSTNTIHKEQPFKAHAKKPLNFKDLKNLR